MVVVKADIGTKGFGVHCDRKIIIGGQYLTIGRVSGLKHPHAAYAKAKPCPSPSQNSPEGRLSRLVLSLPIFASKHHAISAHTLSSLFLFFCSDHLLVFFVLFFFQRYLLLCCRRRFPEPELPFQRRVQRRKLRFKITIVSCSPDFLFQGKSYMPKGKLGSRSNGRGYSTYRCSRPISRGITFTVGNPDINSYGTNLFKRLNAMFPQDVNNATTWPGYESRANRVTRKIDGAQDSASRDRERWGKEHVWQHQSKRPDTHLRDIMRGVITPS